MARPSGNGAWSPKKNRTGPGGNTIGACSVNVSPAIA
jgi:hypothetical protein